MKDTPSRPHRSALRRGRRSVPGHAYFITKCTRIPNTRHLAIPECAGLVIDSLTWAVSKGWIRLLGLVVMPDHYHVVFALGETKSLSQVMESISKFTARRINQHLGQVGSFWEEGFYDHMLRDRDEFDRALAYVHHNPVEAGLVEEQGDWPHSTANPNYEHLIDWDWIVGIPL